MHAASYTYTLHERCRTWADTVKVGSNASRPPQHFCASRRSFCVAVHLLYRGYNTGKSWESSIILNVFEIVETFKKEQEVHGTACCWSCTSSSPGRSFRETASAPKNQGSKIKPARSNRHKTQQSLRHYTCTTCTTNIEFQCFAHN